MGALRYGKVPLALLVLLFTPLHPVDACSLDNNDTFKKNLFSANKMGFDDAKGWAAEQCDSGRLPDICSNQEHSRKNTKNWMAIRKKTIPWQWIDGSKVDTDIFREKMTNRKRHHRNYGCGLFHGGAGYISRFRCLFNDPAALCEIKENSGCSIEGHWCTQIDGQCFCVAEARNWYHARAICIKIGGRLAILPAKSQWKPLIATLKRNPPAVLTSNFLWIGLHGEDWEETTGPRAGKKVMIDKFAPVDTYNTPRGSCAVVKNNTWHVVSCHEKHHAVSICKEKDGENRQVTSSTWTKKPATDFGRPTSSGSPREDIHVSATVVIIGFSLIKWITGFQRV